MGRITELLTGLLTPLEMAELKKEVIEESKLIDELQHYHTTILGIKRHIDNIVNHYNIVDNKKEAEPQPTQPVSHREIVFETIRASGRRGTTVAKIVNALKHNELYSTDYYNGQSGQQSKTRLVTLVTNVVYDLKVKGKIVKAREHAHWRNVNHD